MSGMCIVEGEKMRKYQLLVDMWTMRVLDNDVTAAGAEEEGALPSEQALTTGA